MVGVKGKSGGSRPNTGGSRPGAGRKPGPTKSVTIHLDEQFYVGGAYGLWTVKYLDRKHIVFDTPLGEIKLVR